MSEFENESGEPITSPDQKEPTSTEKLVERTMKYVESGGLAEGDELHTADGRLRGMPTGEAGETVQDAADRRAAENAPEDDPRESWKQYLEEHPETAEKLDRTKAANALGERLISGAESAQAQQAREEALDGFRQKLYENDEEGFSDLYVPVWNPEYETYEASPNVEKIATELAALMETLRDDPQASDKLVELAQEFEGELPITEILTTLAATKLQQPWADATAELEDLNQHSIDHLEQQMTANPHLDASEVEMYRDALFQQAVAMGSLDPAAITKEQIEDLNFMALVDVDEIHEAEARTEAANRKYNAQADSLLLTAESKNASGTVVMRSVRYPDGTVEEVPFRTPDTIEQHLDFQKARDAFQRGVRRGKTVTTMQELHDEQGNVTGRVPVVTKDVGKVTDLDLRNKRFVDAAKNVGKVAKEDAHGREMRRVQQAAEEARRAQEERLIRDRLR
jgi:hypothetical protein